MPLHVGFTDDRFTSHARSRLIDQNESRPSFFFLANARSFCASLCQNISVGTSFTPIIGVTPIIRHPVREFRLAVPGVQ